MQSNIKRFLLINERALSLCVFSFAYKNIVINLTFELYIISARKKKFLLLFDLYISKALRIWCHQMISYVNSTMNFHFPPMKQLKDCITLKCDMCALYIFSIETLTRNCAPSSIQIRMNFFLLH